MIGKTIHDHYLIQQSIGKGNFSAVYLATDPFSLSQVAVKILKDYSGELDMTREAAILKALRQVQGVPKLLGSGTYERQLYLIQELLDTDVYYLQRKCNPLPVPIVLSIAHAVIKVLKNIHSAGYLHMDIKPDNIGVKRTLKGVQIYLMDFGLAKKYIVNGRHYSVGIARDIRGHPVFASIPVLKSCKPSRRDDLESLMYTLAFMGNGKLPWKVTEESDFGEQWREMAEMKQSCSVKEICGSLPSQFSSILKHVRELAFEEKPAYRYYQELLEQAASQLSIHLKDAQPWDRLLRKSGKLVLSSPSTSAATSCDATPRSAKRRNDIPPAIVFPVPHLSHCETLFEEFSEKEERSTTPKARVQVVITPRLRRHIDELRTGRNLWLS